MVHFYVHHPLWPHTPESTFCFVFSQKFYEQRIPIKIAQSSQRILLLCRGQGLEPRLDFERQLVEFGPILPHSSGDEQDVVIRNPCSFPVEFYNLEFDPQYLEEEKVGGGWAGGEWFEGSKR